jgi:hypothetical protein
MASTGLADLNTLVEFHTGCPSGIKTKREESNELAHAKKADSRLTRVQIDTFKKQIEPVKKHQNAARTYFNSVTLPWGEGGQRLVSYGKWDSVRIHLEKEKMVSERLYHAFLDNMPEHIENCAREGVLGDLFDRDDFKTRDDLLGKWKFYWDQANVPDAEHDVRAGWSPQQVSRMKTVWKAQNDRKVGEAMKTVGTRVEDCLSRISDRMEKYDGKKVGSFKNTMIGNMRELAAMLPAFNLTNDPELEEIHRRILRDICPLDPAELRKSQTMRQDAKSKADDLLARIGNFGNK